MSKNVIKLLLLHCNHIAKGPDTKTLLTASICDVFHEYFFKSLRCSALYRQVPQVPHRCLTGTIFSFFGNTASQRAIKRSWTSYLWHLCYKQVLLLMQQLYVTQLTPVLLLYLREVLRPEAKEHPLYSDTYKYRKQCIFHLLFIMKQKRTNRPSTFS